MKTITTEFQQYLSSNAVDVSIIASRTDSGGVSTPFEVIGIDGTEEVDNDYGVITKNTLNLSVPNTTNNNQPKIQNGIWDELGRLNEDIKLSIYYPSFVTPIPFFNGNIYQSKSGLSNATSNLTIMSGKNITTKITTSDIYTNKKPYEIFSIIMGLCGFNYEINLATLYENENNLLVKYTSYYKANAFSELQQLTEMANSYIIRDTVTKKMKYFSRSKLLELEQNTNNYISNKMSGTLAHITNYEKTLRTDNVKNQLEIYTNQYKEKQNENAYTFSLTLEPGESHEIDQKFSEGEYYTNFSTVLNSATTGEDGSGDDYALINTSIIQYTLNTYPNGVNGTITNNHSATLYVNLTLKGTAKIPYQTSNKYKDDDSINNYGTKEYNLNNKYIQSLSVTNNIGNDILNRFKAPEIVLSIEIIGNPIFELLDALNVRMYNLDGVNYEQHYGIIKRINYTYNITNGYKQTLELTQFNI